MKNWRPDGWQEILEKICGENPHGYDVHFVEAGADAILRALLELDTWVQVNGNGELLVSPAFQASDWKKYRLVFIPEGIE